MSISINNQDGITRLVYVKGKHVGSYLLSPFPGCCGIKVLSYVNFNDSIKAQDLLLAILLHENTKTGARILAMVDAECREGMGATADLIYVLKKDIKKFSVKGKFSFKNPITGNTLTYLCVDMIDSINNLLEE